MDVTIDPYAAGTKHSFTPRALKFQRFIDIDDKGKYPDSPLYLYSSSILERMLTNTLELSRCEPKFRDMIIVTLERGRTELRGRKRSNSNIVF